MNMVSGQPQDSLGSSLGFYTRCEARLEIFGSVRKSRSPDVPRKVSQRKARQKW